MARGPEGGVGIGAGRVGGIGAAAGRSFGGAPSLNIGGAERSVSAVSSNPRLTLGRGLGAERNVSPKTASVLNKHTVRTFSGPRLDTDSSPRFKKSEFGKPGTQNDFGRTAFVEFRSKPALEKRSTPKDVLVRRNVARHEAQAPNVNKQPIRRVNPNVRYEPYRVDPTTVLSGGSQGVLSPAELDTLLDRPQFTGFARRVEPVSKSDIVRIIPFDKKPINSERIVQPVRSEELRPQPSAQEAITRELRILSDQRDSVTERVTAVTSSVESVSSLPVFQAGTELQAVSSDHDDASGSKAKRLLEAKENMKVALQDEAQKAEATQTLRGKLRKGREIIARKIKGALRVSIVSSQITSPDVEAVLETNEKKRKKRLAKLVQRFVKVLEPNYEAKAQQVQVVEKSDKKLQTARQIVSTSEEGQENQQAVELKMRTVKINELVTLQKLRFQTFLRQRVSMLTRAESLLKKVEFFISKPTQKNRLDVGMKGIWLSFAGTHKDKIAANQIVENFPRPSVPTTSPILLKHGMGDVVEAQKQADPTDIAWRQEFAGKGDLTQREAQDLLVFVVERHKPVDVGEGDPRASDADVQKVIGEKLVSQVN